MPRGLLPMPQLDLVRTAVAGWQAGRQADCLAGWLVDSCSVQFSSIGAEDMFPQPSPNKPPSRPHPQPHPQRWPWSLIWASVDCAWLLQRQGRSILPLRSGPDPWMPGAVAVPGPHGPVATDVRRLIPRGAPSPGRVGGQPGCLLHSPLPRHWLRPAVT